MVGLSVLLGFAATLPPRTLAIAVAAAALAVFALAPPRTILLVLIATMPWEGYLRYPTATLTVSKIVGLLLLGVFVVRAMIEHRRLRFPPPVIAVGLFGLAVLLSLLVSTDPSTGVAKAVRYELYVVFFFLVVQLTETRRDAIVELEVLTASATAAAVVGLVLFLSGAKERAGGPVTDPNDFAFVLACVVPVGIYLARAGERLATRWALASVILLGGVLGTLSRGALVGLAALLLWALVWHALRWGALVAWLAAAAAVLTVAIHYAAPSIKTPLEHKSHIAHQNITSRRALWQASLRMWTDYPVAGVGPARFGPESDRYFRDRPFALTGAPRYVWVGKGAIHGPADLRVHNSYLEVLAENGAVGLLAFGSVLVLAWRGLTRRLHRTERLSDRRLIVGLQGAMVVAGITGIFISVQVAFPFWLIGAVATGIAYPPRDVSARAP